MSPEQPNDGKRDGKTTSHRRVAALGLLCLVVGFLVQQTDARAAPDTIAVAALDRTPGESPADHARLALQQHSHDVYLALRATLARDERLSAPFVVVGLTLGCLNGQRGGLVNGFVVEGWPSAPPQAQTCTITANGPFDFTVTVTGDASTGGAVFVNGAASPRR